MYLATIDRLPKVRKRAARRPRRKRIAAAFRQEEKGGDPETAVHPSGAHGVGAERAVSAKLTRRPASIARTCTTAFP